MSPPAHEPWLSGSVLCLGLVVETSLRGDPPCLRRCDLPLQPCLPSPEDGVGAELRAGAPGRGWVFLVSSPPRAPRVPNKQMLLVFLSLWAWQGLGGWLPGPGGRGQCAVYYLTGRSTDLVLYICLPLFLLS